MSILQFDSVTKVYRVGFRARRVTAVENLSYSVDTPGIIGFVGPNGAGKTTSIKVLLGLVRPTRGVVRLKGIPADRPEARKAVAFVPEQPALYPYLTVGETLEFAFRLSCAASGGAGAAVSRVVERMGLGGHERKKVGQLSKGLQQRLSIGMALLAEADVYVLDEPMSGMDPLGRRLVRDLIGELGGRGATVFFSTHVLDDVRALCSRVVALNAGRLAYNGDLATLMARGRQGTDITVETLDDKTWADLRSMGCAVDRASDATVVVFAPATVPQQECQKLLHSNGHAPLSVTPRTLPLEDVLYGPMGGRGAQ